MSDGGEIVMGPWAGKRPEPQFVAAKEYLLPYAEINYDIPTTSVEPTIVKIEPKPSPQHQFLTRLQERSDANVQTAVRKNADYANSDRPYANFEAAPLVGVSVARGMLVRMQDKLQRISNLLDRPACNESIQDSCDDLSVYALILGCYLEQNES